MFFLSSIFTRFSFIEEDRPRPQPNRLRNAAPRRAQMARNRGARLRANGKLIFNS